jgi:hypothetical protein
VTTAFYDRNGWFCFRKLDDAPGLTEMAGDVLVDPRTGSNGRRTLAQGGLLLFGSGGVHRFHYR